MQQYAMRFRAIELRTRKTRKPHEMKENKNYNKKNIAFDSFFFVDNFIQSAK